MNVKPIAAIVLMFLIALNVYGQDKPKPNNLAVFVPIIDPYPYNIPKDDKPRFDVARKLLLKEFPFISNDKHFQRVVETVYNINEFKIDKYYTADGQPLIETITRHAIYIAYPYIKPKGADIKAIQDLRRLLIEDEKKKRIKEAKETIAKESKGQLEPKILRRDLADAQRQITYLRGVVIDQQKRLRNLEILVARLGAQRYSRQPKVTPQNIQSGATYQQNEDAKNALENIARQLEMRREEEIYRGRLQRR